MATRIWLMRHAETSQPGVFHGFESDIDLSPLGHRQAEAVAPIIAGYRPDAIYSSGMLRARQTADPIARACRLPVIIEPELHERKVGSLAGTPAQPELGIWPDTLKHWIEGDVAYAPDGAESYVDIQRRVLPAWDQIVEANVGRSLVVICHGIVCRVLLLSLLPNQSVADWAKLGHVGNISISELNGSGRDWQALRIGEVPAEVRCLE